MSNSDLQGGIIAMTNASCIVKGQQWPDISTLVWPDGVDVAVSDWLRYLVVDCAVASSSAYEYAKVIRPFRRFCRACGRTWEMVDDSLIKIYRGHLMGSLKLEAARVNMVLDTIFRFYRWAEETKRIRYRVKIYPEDEIPKQLRDVEFAIGAKRFFRKSTQGRIITGDWAATLRVSGGKKSARVRHTPNESQIRQLHDVAASQLHGERNSLMFSWADEAGARRKEFLQVKKSDLPTDTELINLIECDQPWHVSVKRKGGSLGMLYALPDLIIRTLDYIKFERREIVDYCLKNIVGYREPDEIFISSTTGRPLEADSVTAIGLKTFKKAGIKKASIHRLRASYAIRTIEALLDALDSGVIVGSESSFVETILVKAAEMMGHASPSSLRPYLTYVLNRRLQASDAIKSDRLASRLRQLRLYEGTMVRRIARHQGLHLAGTLIQSGKNAEAASVLRQLASDLDDDGAVEVLALAG